jgi:sporulation protein YlmC with PRC-barrel domain
MPRQELQVELLLGRRVYALNGQTIGRLEEVRAEVRQGVASVDEYLVGTYASLERLAAWKIGRAMLGVFGSRIRAGYRVRWDQIDFSDPKRPRLTCTVTELSPLEE